MIGYIVMIGMNDRRNANDREKGEMIGEMMCHIVPHSSYDL